MKIFCELCELLLIKVEASARMTMGGDGWNSFDVCDSHKRWMKSIHRMDIIYKPNQDVITGFQLFYKTTA